MSTLANSAKGRFVGWADGVEINSPAGAVFRLFALVSTNVDADFRDVNTISDLLALPLTDEATNANYANIAMDATDIIITEDDAGDRMYVQGSDQTFTGIGVGDNWTHLAYGWDDDGTDTDTNTQLISVHDFVVVPNTGDIIADEPADGFAEAA